MKVFLVRKKKILNFAVQLHITHYHDIIICKTQEKDIRGFSKHPHNMYVT